MTPPKPKAPAGLAARGVQFWRDTVAEFELTAGELHLLHGAARTLYRLDWLEAAVAAEGTTTKAAWVRRRCTRGSVRRGNASS